MKIGTRPQIWFASAFCVLFVIYVPYQMWNNRDITWHWKDEVQLADGTRLWIERSEVREFRAGGEPFRPRSRGTKISRLELPGNTQPVIWEARLLPMVVERGSDPDKWIVIASSMWCDDYRQYGSPNPPYIQFEYFNGQWAHRPVERSWYGRPSNLLMKDEKREFFDGGKATAEQIVQANVPLYPSPDFTRYLLITQKSESKCN